ncbi:MAG: helix-turn-helix domain-containing protein [Oscillospiraceae bacterium]|nr:helix-turn-helix domain-containing protein [Oscillospiraceae bacterium]
MFAENLKTLRKKRGLSQEELAIRLNVVRQTVSKWEKGLSVPDADILIRIADTFEVSVSALLGARIETETEINAVAEQLSRINEQLAIKNRRARRIWKTVVIIFCTIIVLTIGFIILNVYTFKNVVESVQPQLPIPVEGKLTTTNESLG